MGQTAWLAGTGGAKRSEERPYLSLLMGAKILLDMVSAAELAREEWNENKKLCPYCQTATFGLGRVVGVGVARSQKRVGKLAPGVSS